MGGMLLLKMKALKVPTLFIGYTPPTLTLALSRLTCTTETTTITNIHKLTIIKHWTRMAENLTNTHKFMFIIHQTYKAENKLQTPILRLQLPTLPSTRGLQHLSVIKRWFPCSTLWMHNFKVLR